jgi:hypothetical protein
MDSQPIFSQYSKDWPFNKFFWIFMLILFPVVFSTFLIFVDLGMALSLLILILLIISEIFSYIVLLYYLHYSQDIVLEENGIRWPKTKFSFSTERKQILVPFNEVSYCVIGFEQLAKPVNYFYIESKKNRLKYFTFGKTLDIELIRRRIREKNLFFEKRTFMDTWMMYIKAFK